MEETYCSLTNVVVKFIVGVGGIQCFGEVSFPSWSGQEATSTTNGFTNDNNIHPVTQKSGVDKGSGKWIRAVDRNGAT